MQNSYTEAFHSLEALSLEVGFRSGDSIRAQVRKLFADLPGVDTAKATELQRRALRVYDGRSTLVVENYLTLFPRIVILLFHELGRTDCY
jgi:hypothetical protein